MPYTLEQFCADAKTELKRSSGPDGRKAVMARMQQLLANPDFVAKVFPSEKPEGRTTLYEDKELGFCVLAHIDRTPRVSAPHDHGPSWAIYAQAIGWSEMTLWTRKDGGKGAGKAELELAETYRLTPGKAGIFNEGDIHGVGRSPGDCCYLRVTGMDLERTQRLKFDLKGKTATVIESAGVNA